MRLLLDENISDRRLAARLRAQGHDPVLATGVGLLSATDARVFIAAITQALPVLTRDSGTGSGTGPILLSQASFLLAHIANSGPVPLSASRFPLSASREGI